MRTRIKIPLEKMGYDIIGEAPNGKSAIELAIKFKPDLICLDNVLPDMFGYDIMEYFNENEMKFKVIMISAAGQALAIKEAKSLGIDDYLVKPFEISDLKDKVARLLA
jgi:two-component system chemotaxis response regulator CheY